MLLLSLLCGQICHNHHNSLLKRCADKLLFSRHMRTFNEAKTDNPGLHLDTSALPTAGMFTNMEHEAHLESERTSADARCLTNECDDDDVSIIQKDHAFKKQLHFLAAQDEQIAAFVNGFSWDQQRMPSILDFAPSARSGRLCWLINAEGLSCNLIVCR